MPKKRMTRRDFIKIGVAGAGAALASSLTLDALQGAEALPPMPFPSEGAYLLGPPIVSVAYCPSYSPEDVRSAVQRSLQLAGGIEDVVRPGDVVGLKPNLSSAKPGSSLAGVATDAGVVGALIEEIQDRSPEAVWILEGEYPGAFHNLGYDAVAAQTGSHLLNTNDPSPYFELARVRTRTGLEYDSFLLNRGYVELDVLLSVAKLKIHSTAGVALSLKNLIGCMPLSVYKHPTEQNRGDHVHREGWRRVARVIADLNTTIPIHFSLIDGVVGREKGEGTWVAGSSPVGSGIIIAGRNAVAADSVAMHLMGHDPAGDYPKPPFINGQNHLRIAAELGLGPTSLDQMELNVEDGRNLGEMTVPYLPPDPTGEVPADFVPNGPMAPIPEFPFLTRLRPAPQRGGLLARVPGDLPPILRIFNDRFWGPVPPPAYRSYQATGP